MSLNVSIDDVPFAILEMVKARILAQRQKQQQAKPTAPKGPRPQFRRFGASSKAYRQPQPAALPDDSDRAFAHAGLYAWREGDTAYWRIYSGDLSTYASGSETSASVNEFLWSYLALPVDGETCIVVLMGRIRDLNQAELNEVTRKVFNKSYVCSLEAVRQIQIPSQMQIIIEVLNPQDPAADYNEYEPPGVDSSPFPPRQISNANAGYAGADSDEDWTPTIYELLDRVSNYIDNDQLQQFPADSTPITGDFRDGWFKPNNLDGDRSRYYAEWLGDPGFVDYSRPDLLEDLPDNTLAATDDWPPSGPWSNEPSFPDAWAFAWDWDDPDYCRAMCAALGFTDADLTP